MYKPTKILLATIVLSISIPCAARDCVVLLHGLARTSSSLEKLETSLAAEGYKVVNLDYPSRKLDIPQLAIMAVGGGAARCGDEKPEKIHYVTHSLGGILVRQYLSEHTLPNLGRVVMLGPPNKGSEVVDKLRDLPGFAMINGPAGLQLGTGELDIPGKLGPADFEVGIIAGTRSINLLLSAMIPATDDGKVAIENTHLENETDFLALPVTHPFMMNNPAVIGQVLYFLKNGRFFSSTEQKAE